MKTNTPAEKKQISRELKIAELALAAVIDISTDKKIVKQAMAAWNQITKATVENNK